MCVCMYLLVPLKDDNVALFRREQDRDVSRQMKVVGVMALAKYI